MWAELKGFKNATLLLVTQCLTEGSFQGTWDPKLCQLSDVLTKDFPAHGCHFITVMHFLSAELTGITCCIL